MEEDHSNDDIEIYFQAPDQDENDTEEENFNASSDSEHERLIRENDESNQSQELSEEANNGQAGSTNVPNQRRVSYDRYLPASHSYLGNDFQELNGRIVLEEESIVTIPLLCLPGVVLIPGQLLPLQFHGSYFTNTIKGIIDGNKIFGLVSNFNNSVTQSHDTYNNVKLNCLGTVVEVRSYGTEDDGAILKIKAEGKERFLIKETWTETNRTVMGKVFILPEINLKHPFHRDIGLSSMGSRFNKKLLGACTQYPAHAYQLYDPDFLMEKIRGHLNQWASFSTSSKSNETQSSSVYENRTISQATGTNQPSVERSETSAEDSRSVRPTNTEISPDAPVSVNTTRTVVTRIVPVRDSESEEEESEEEEHGFKAYAPANPSGFSFWVTANLPLEDHQRLILLSLNSPIQRLRWQSSFFEKYLSLSCTNCDALICSCKDIFSMSIKGYQDVFVNAHGVIHDTLTVVDVKNVVLEGRKCAEYSWFPNYSWIIISCSSCGHHMGWKFVANNRNLSPQHFYGISRRNVKPAIDKATNKDHDLPLESSAPLI